MPVTASNHLEVVRMISDPIALRITKLPQSYVCLFFKIITPKNFLFPTYVGRIFQTAYSQMAKAHFHSPSNLLGFFNLAKIVIFNDDFC
uniref:Ovule protein n=1 Tax=Elaeophora elaphi TaxID=1147741 RepID=A0A0R3RLC4_9BILA